MPAPCEIQVVVTNADGLPIDGANVFALTSSGHQPQTCTDSSGRASICLPADAEWRAIAAFKDGAGFDYRLVWNPHEIRTDPYHLLPELPQTVSLVLDGARSVQMLVRDREGNPLAGAQVGPCTLSKSSRGGYLYSAFEFTKRTTNSDGLATFDFIHHDLSGPNHFTAEMDGWEATDIVVLDAEKPASLLKMTLVPLVPVTGRVCDTARAPVAGASVHASAAAYHLVRSEYHTTTAADGTFTLQLPADRLCVVFARHDSRASLAHTRVSHDSLPLPLELVLGIAPHLSGQVTTGPEHAPLANVRISLEYEFALNTADGIRDTLPGEPFLLYPSITLNVTTDDQGNFEMYTAPGAYSVRCALESQEVKKLADVTLAEVWIPLHFESLSATLPTFSGRIVDSSNHSVAFASVTTCTDRENREKAFSGTTDTDGYFTLPRPSTSFLLIAISRSDHLAGQLHVSSIDSALNLALGPATRAIGRLLHPDGTPAKDERLYCELLLDEDLGRANFPITFRACTDSDGRFVLNDLLPKHNYKLQHFDPSVPQSTKLATFHADYPGDFLLGDLSLPVSP